MAAAMIDPASAQMAQRLADLSGELDLLFTDPLWSWRATAGLDRDDPTTNPQSMVGEAAEALHQAVRALEIAVSARQQIRDRLRGTKQA